MEKGAVAAAGQQDTAVSRHWKPLAPCQATEGGHRAFHWEPGLRSANFRGQFLGAGLKQVSARWRGVHPPPRSHEEPLIQACGALRFSRNHTNPGKPSIQFEPFFHVRLPSSFKDFETKRLPQTHAPDPPVMEVQPEPSLRDRL